MNWYTAVCLLCFSFTSSILAQEIDSGPAKGKTVPELKVYAVSGPIQAETVDYAAQRKGKATIYVVITANKFSRPMHGFLQALEKAVDKEIKDGLVVAVWLTDDVQKTRDYLPQITKYYASAALSCFPGEKTGPKDWFINEQADATVILAHQGKVVGRFGYGSINDAVAHDLVTALRKALKAN
jgi:hypothetical protein